MNADEVREYLKHNPDTHWIRRGESYEPVSESPPRLICDGPPMTYRPPRPLDAEQVAEIVRTVLRTELDRRKDEPGQGESRSLTQDERRYWSPQRAARECSVSERTFAEWMRYGKVRYYKIGRRILIDPTELKEDLGKFRRQRTGKRRMRREEVRV